MLKNLAVKLGLKGCPLAATRQIGLSLVSKLEGYVAQDVIDLLQDGIRKFVPRGSQEGAGGDIKDFLFERYGEKGGDVEIMGNFFDAMKTQGAELKEVLLIILVPQDIARRAKNPDLYGADNILYGMNHLHPSAEEKIKKIFGENIFGRKEYFAAHLSLLIKSLTDFMNEEKINLFNPLFERAIDEFERSRQPIDLSGKVSPEERHGHFLKHTTKSITDITGKYLPSHVLQNANRFFLLEQIMFLFSHSFGGRKTYKEGSLAMEPVMTGIHAAIVFTTYILYILQQYTWSNKDGSLSAEQEDIWKKTVSKCILPLARDVNQVWMGLLFPAMNAKGIMQYKFDPGYADNMLLVGEEGKQHLDFQPELRATLDLHMMAAGGPRHGCPAGRAGSRGGKPLTLRILDIVHQSYNDSKVALLPPEAYENDGEGD